MIDQEHLLAQLADELPAQRWFGASSVAGIDVVRELPEKLVQVIVRGDDGGRYQTVLGVRDDGSIVDATTDSNLSLALFHQTMPDEDVAKVRPLGAEQSNTSLVFDERIVLKLFRRLTDGQNPDVEVTRALAEHGYTHVVAPMGEWRDDDGDYAVVTELLIGAADGWQVALTSLHDLYDRRVPPDEAAGDFGFEAQRLGRTIAELHVAMAEAFGIVEADVEGWIADMASQLARVDMSARDARAARVVYESLRDVDAGPSFRIHGDLHLGQTLLHDLGWYVLDFEGEPARPIDERRRPSTPMRDVAGMVRSLHYAAQVALRDIGGVEDADLRALADGWERHNAERFLAGYSGYGDVARILPLEDARATVQRAFELDKAVYEVAYEQGHRPDWADIPLSAVRRLLEV
ncbi:MAG: maltokinase [Actinomycetota bacterium]